jgi:tetratricopeptide (TPR) repeat protein
MPTQYQQFIRHIFLGVLFIISLTFCLGMSYSPVTDLQVGIGQLVNTRNIDTVQMVQLGIERYKAGDFQGAIELWQPALNVYKKNRNRVNEAIVLENMARAYQQLGKHEEAITNWERVISYYRQIQDLPQMARMETEQAQAYISLSQPEKAISLLKEAVEIAHNYKDMLTKAAALGSLDDAYRLMDEKYS